VYRFYATRRYSRGYLDGRCFRTGEWLGDYILQSATLCGNVGHVDDCARTDHAVDARVSDQLIGERIRCSRYRMVYWRPDPRMDCGYCYCLSGLCDEKNTVWPVHLCHWRK